MAEDNTEDPAPSPSRMLQAVEAFKAFMAALKGGGVWATCTILVLLCVYLGRELQQSNERIVEILMAVKMSKTHVIPEVSAPVPSVVPVPTPTPTPTPERPPNSGPFDIPVQNTYHGPDPQRILQKYSNLYSQQVSQQIKQQQQQQDLEDIRNRVAEHRTVRPMMEQY